MATQQRTVATPRVQQQNPASIAQKFAPVSSRPVLSTEQKVLPARLPSTIDDAIIAAGGGKAFLDKVLAKESKEKQLRKKYGRRRVDRRSTYRRGANADQRTSYFGMDGNRLGPVGGRVSRVYQLDINIQNSSASASNSSFFNFNIRQLAGVYSLAMYEGRAIAGTGTNIAEASRFPTEAAIFCQAFKWINIDAIEMEMIPVVRDLVATAEGPPTITKDDCGTMFFGQHDGDEAIYDITSGVATIGYQEIQMLSHKTILPLGEHSKMVAAKPITPANIINETGDVQTVFQRTRPIRTLELFLGSPDQQYPFSGLWWYWYHPNLAVDGDQNKFFVRAKVRIQVSWNTVQDVVILADDDDGEKKELQQLNKQLAGQPIPVKADNGEQKYYGDDPLGLNTDVKSVTEDYIKVK